MTPVAPSAIHARHRPVAVLFVFFAELAWALVIATPVHAWARRVWGAHPDGDAVLWKGGGRDLLIWLGQNDAGSAVTTRTAIVLLFVGIVLMQLPLGALLASLAFSRSDPEPGAGTSLRASLRPTEALRVGIGAFLPLCGVLALGSVVSVLVLAAGALASSAVDHGLAEALGDARAFTMRLVTLGAFALIAAVIGVIVDLARAAIVRETGTAIAAGNKAPGLSVMLRGLRTALAVARRGLFRATLAWAGRVVVGVALIGIGYVAADALGGGAAPAVGALFAIHQLVVLGRVSLRASWLARAIAMIAPVQDARTAK